MVVNSFFSVHHHNTRFCLVWSQWTKYAILRAKTHALSHNAASHLLNESHSALESTVLVVPVKDVPDYGFFSSFYLVNQIKCSAYIVSSS